VEVPADVEDRLRSRMAEFRKKVEQRPPSRIRALIYSLFHPASFRVPLMTAALLAVIVTLAIFPRGSNAGRVYAAAATQLRSARSLEYTVAIAPGAEVDFSYLAPGFRRIKLSWGMEIRSDGSGKQIVLMHLTKKYIVGKEEQSEVPDLVNQLKLLPQTPDQSIGEQWADGRKLMGYRVHETQSGTTFPGAIPGLSALDLWVDADTGNPDHVDISIQELNKPLYQMHIKNIHLDTEMNPSLFDMTPPAGYSKMGIPDAGQQAKSSGIHESTLHPEVKEFGALTAVVLPMNGSFLQTRTAGHAVENQLEMLKKQLKKIGVTPDGPAFGRYDPQRNWVAGYPVPPGTHIDSPSEILSLPETTMASVVVTGPWGQEFDSPWGRDPGSRWATFVTWIGRQGYKPTGPPMEFWSGDESHPQAQTTEMRIAVTRGK